MSAIEPNSLHQVSEKVPSKVRRLILSGAKSLVRLSFLTLMALILLLLPALFVKQPQLPHRKLSEPLLPRESDTFQSHSKSSKVAPPTLSTLSSGGVTTTNIQEYRNFPSYLDSSQSLSERYDEVDISEQPSTSERAQFSFARFSSPVATNFSNFQIGGITVQGPILSGRALARDSQGRLVRSLSQPNLLVAGRGFIPSTSLRSTSVGTNNGPLPDTRALTTAQTNPPISENDDARQEQVVRESFGIFDFTTDESGNSTVTRNRGGTSEVVASRRQLTESSEQIVLTGRSALPTWNEFVGELFLIIVSPSLVGERTVEGFQLQKLDSNNHLQILALRNGDIVRLVNGEPITNVTIEALPDLLLERQVEITVRRKEGRDLTTFVTLDV